MRYRELFEFQIPAAGTTFYHVTTNNRLKSIMATGLDPHRRHRRWKNAWGATLGENGVIYLISTFTEAVRFAAKQDYQHRINQKKLKTIILVLHDVPIERMQSDDHIEGQLAGHTWFKTPLPIPPQNIVRIIPLTQDLVKQVIDGTLPAEPPEDDDQPANPKTVSQPENHPVL